MLEIQPHCLQPAPAINVLLPPVAAACYNYSPQQPDGTLKWVCPTPQRTVGVSYNIRTGPNVATTPYDQGIVFMDQVRPGPYFQYNYMENINPASSTNSWQVQGYIGPGSTTLKSESCGCRACPSMTCNLAKAGPRTGALASDPSVPGNLAYNPLLESCQGGSGSCLSINGEACCVGVSSYEYRPSEGTSPCVDLCRNFWSGISKDKPLSALWGSIMKDLPLAEITPASLTEEEGE